MSKDRRAKDLARMMSGKRMTPKFAKPRVFLIDMDDACETALRDAGYNVTVGSFGTPLNVPPSERLYHVTLDSCELPSYEEQEIIIVNTARPSSIDGSLSDNPGDGVSAIWQRADEGVLDPRPFAMMHVQRAFDRILAHGGIAIVLLGRRYEVQYIKGSAREFGSFRGEGEFTSSSWSFLSELTELGTAAGHGAEIEFSREGRDFAALLKRGADDAKYMCRIQPAYHQQEHWVTIATDKFGNCVAGVLMKTDPPALMIVLPQMPQLSAVACDLIGNWCAQWRPRLFPFHEGRSWLHTDRYELPSVSRMRNEGDRIKEEANNRIKELESQILKERAANKDWYALLNGTGSELVEAVISGLRKLGFVNVVDVDQQAREDGSEGNLREDVQIHDQSPILIADIKGITGGPEDSEATQAEKHALMRAREFSGDVKPLTIINHERNLPPHDRNPNPYRDEIIGNAQQTGLGLMTTWDIFRLLRNKEKLGWTDDVVKPIFYRTGRIEPIPEHYEEIGRIERVWEHAVGVIPKASVLEGTRLAIEVGDLFDEIVAASLRVDDVEVTEAPRGSNCGIACEDTKQFKKGMRVFIVRAQDAT